MDNTQNNENNAQEIPKHKGKLQALDSLSLGISIAAAILIGAGLGYLLKEWTGYDWLLWLGIFYGIAAAILNVYKAYKRAKKDLDELADDPRYKHRAEHGDGIKND